MGTSLIGSPTVLRIRKIETRPAGTLPSPIEATVAVILDYQCSFTPYGQHSHLIVITSEIDKSTLLSCAMKITATAS